MDPLPSTIFVPPKTADVPPGTYKRTAAGEPANIHHSEVRKWMSRLLRIPEGAPGFWRAHDNEDDLVSGKLSCFVDPVTNLTWLYSWAGEPVCYLAGRYNIESVEHLQERNPFATRPIPLGLARTKLIVVTGLRDFSDPNFDVRSLQANPRNCGATFQVASNFNGLEYTSAFDNRHMGVARYVYDRTQGPSASESCGPATLYRNYFVDGNDYQHQSRRYYQYERMAIEVNTLDDPNIRDLLPVDSGYVTFYEAPKQEDLVRLDSDAYKYVKIVRHDFAQVTYGLRHESLDGTEVMDVCNDPTQIVNQVFNAGINWVDMIRYVRDEETRRKFAMFLSKASMISSLLAAQENRDALVNVPSCQGRNRFFPNLVGCGVFANQREWLIDAWRSPEVFPYIQHSGLEIIVCFQAAESAEALDFARQAKEGKIPDFEGQAIDVQFVDAADHAAMATVFGPLHPQAVAPPVDLFPQAPPVARFPPPPPTTVVDPDLEAQMAAERDRQRIANERAHQERLAAERLAAERLANSLAVQQQERWNQLQGLLTEHHNIAERSGQATQGLLPRLETLQRQQQASRQGIDQLRGWLLNWNEANIGRLNSHYSWHQQQLQNAFEPLRQLGADLESQQRLEESFAVMDQRICEVYEQLTPMWQQQFLAQRQRHVAADNLTRRLAVGVQELAGELRVALRELQQLGTQLEARCHQESQRLADMSAQEEQRRVERGINWRAEQEQHLAAELQAHEEQQHADEPQDSFCGKCCSWFDKY